LNGRGEKKGAAETDLRMKADATDAAANSLIMARDSGRFMVSAKNTCGY